MSLPPGHSRWRKMVTSRGGSSPRDCRGHQVIDELGVTTYGNLHTATPLKARTPAAPGILEETALRENTHRLRVHRMGRHSHGRLGHRSAGRARQRGLGDVLPQERRGHPGLTPRRYPSGEGSVSSNDEHSSRPFDVRRVVQPRGLNAVLHQCRDHSVRISQIRPSRGRVTHNQQSMRARRKDVAREVRWFDGLVHSRSFSPRRSNRCGT
jgi:hypothetical protein